MTPDKPIVSGLRLWEKDELAAKVVSLEAEIDRLLAHRTPIKSSIEPVACAKPAVYISANDVLALVPDDMADTVRSAFEALPEPPMGEKVLPLYLAAPVSAAPAVTRPLTRGERQIEYLLLAMERSEGVTPFYGNTEPRPACFSEEEWTRLLLTSDAIMEHGWKEYVELHGVEL